MSLVKHIFHHKLGMARRKLPKIDFFKFVKCLKSSKKNLSATPFCFEELYILQGSEVSMSNFVLLFDTWFLPPLPYFTNDFMLVSLLALHHLINDI